MKTEFGNAKINNSGLCEIKKVSRLYKCEGSDDD